jgi:hypothetical protein
MKRIRCGELVLTYDTLLQRIAQDLARRISVLILDEQQKRWSCGLPIASPGERVFTEAVEETLRSL